MGPPPSEPPVESDSSTISRQILMDLGAFTELATTFYRAEVDRMTAWRTRLDQTTNWAVVLVAAILTWSFSSPDNPHYVILIGDLGVTAFLLMEANRYREYDVWRDRVRTLQREFIAEVFDPVGSEETDWRAPFGEELRNPRFEISFWSAFGHRLRRTYLALLLLLLAAWVARILLLEHQEPWQVTATILGVPGPVVASVVGAFYVAVIAAAAWSARGSRVREFDR